MNNIIHDDARRRAIKLTLERNPFAFHPKIGNFQEGNNGGFVALPHATQAFGQSTEVAGELYPYEQCLGESVAKTIKTPISISTGFLSVEVAEAACSCMLAQLDETKQRDSSPSQQERFVIEEFGRCLEQILDTAMKRSSTDTREKVPIGKGVMRNINNESHQKTARNTKKWDLFAENQKHL
ncbi:hypothetical protein X801_02757 [Opisthorchis viverrini]|uniref:Uncharacterized protein n=1 Tax=Opisthorchis viverrini TaxID=6198 RepID=A0A1S8X3N3_OPIVI|nr:hypothetical protein X801_02757 [Opisthorchis viverrini]